MYLSVADSKKWGSDELEDATIPVGGRFTITDVPPGGYDIRYEACDESVEPLERYNLDVDADIEITIFDTND